MLKSCYDIRSSRGLNHLAASFHTSKQLRSSRRKKNSVTSRAGWMCFRSSVISLSMLCAIHPLCCYIHSVYSVTAYRIPLLTFTCIIGKNLTYFDIFLRSLLLVFSFRWALYHFPWQVIYLCILDCLMLRITLVALQIFLLPVLFTAFIFSLFLKTVQSPALVVWACIYDKSFRAPREL